MKKLNENGKVGLFIAIISIVSIWGTYITYIFPPLKEFYIPMIGTAIVLFIAMGLYFIYQTE